MNITTRRATAFIIDIFLLLLIHVLFSYFTNIKPPTGSFYVLSLIYFSFLDSNLIPIKSFGKYIFNIHVININGKGLNISLSFVRSFLFLLPIAAFNTKLISYVDTFISIPHIATLPSLLYAFSLFNITLTILNKQYYRGIHEIISNSYTTRKRNFNAIISKPISQNIFISLVITIALFSIPFFHTIYLNKFSHDKSFYLFSNLRESISKDFKTNDIEISLTGEILNITITTKYSRFESSVPQLIAYLKTNNNGLYNTSKCKVNVQYVITEEINNLWIFKNVEEIKYSSHTYNCSSYN